MSHAHGGIGDIMLNLMLFHFLNQPVDLKSCLLIQNEGKNSHFYAVHRYWGDGPSWENFCKWIWRQWQTWWAKQWARVRHLSVPQKPQRKVSISLPGVTEERYLNTAEIRHPIISVHAYEFITQHHLNWHNKSTPNFQQPFTFIAYADDLFMEVQQVTNPYWLSNSSEFF